MTGTNTAVAAALSRLELIRQVAAADIGAQACGHRDGGLAALPVNVLESLAREAEKRHRHTPPVVHSESALANRAAQPDTEVTEQPPWVTLPNHDRMQDPSDDRPAARTQQKWRPELLTPSTGGVPASVSSIRTLPSNWRALRRRLVPAANVPDAHQEGIANADSDDGNKSYTPMGSEPQSSRPCADEEGSASVCSDSAPGSGTESGSASDHDATPVAAMEERSIGPSDCNGGEDAEVPLEASVQAVEHTPDAEALNGPEPSNLPDGPPALDDKFTLLRSLLADAVEIVDWYPASEDEKLAKAELLSSTLPRLLETLENGVLNVVLEDTVAELTRIGITKELDGVPLALPAASRAGNITDEPLLHQLANGPHQQAPNRDVERYIEMCALQEAELLRKYRCHL